MEEKVITNGLNYVCIECGNENTLPEDAAVGDVVECAFCGIEYEIIEKDEAGNFTLQVIEEEK